MKDWKPREILLFNIAFETWKAPLNLEEVTNKFAILGCEFILKVCPCNVASVAVMHR